MASTSISGQMRSRRWLLCMSAVLLFGVGLLPAQSSTGKPLRVLFIGNSLTFYNKLPTMVEILSEKAPSPKAIEVASVTVPGATLQKHWDKGDAQRKIQEGHWDFVVLQGQSLECITHKEVFYHHARLFDAEIRKSGAKTLLYMTWALSKAPEQQAAITESYRTLGKELGARVIPVGVARERLLKLNPSAPITLKDGKHPSPTGTYLAACLFYAAFTGKSAVGLPFEVADPADAIKPLVKLAADEARSCQRIADELAKEARGG